MRQLVHAALGLTVALGAGACLDFTAAQQACHDAGRCSGEGGGAGGAGGGAGGGGGGLALVVVSAQPVSVSNGACATVVVEVRDPATSQAVSGLTMDVTASTAMTLPPVLVSACTAAPQQSLTQALQPNGQVTFTVRGDSFGPVLLQLGTSTGLSATANLAFMGNASLSLARSTFAVGQCVQATVSAISTGTTPAVALPFSGSVNLTSTRMSFFSDGACTTPATSVIVPTGAATVGLSATATATGTATASSQYLAASTVPFTVRCDATTCTGCCQGSTCVTSFTAQVCPGPAGAGGACAGCNLITADGCGTLAGRATCTCAGAAPCASGSRCGAAGCAPGWTRVFPPPAVDGGAAWPPGRAMHAMAFDPGTASVILYGGSRSPDGGTGVSLGDTWLWNGSAWTAVTVNPAAPRYALAMASSSTRGVLFTAGTDAANPFQATYHFNGPDGGWVNLGAPIGQRWGHAMAATDQGDLVECYGATNLAGTALRGDCQAMVVGGPVNWQNVGSSATPRLFASGAPWRGGAANQLVFAGGVDQTGTPLSDVNLLNGTGWSLGPALPAPTFGHTLISDSATTFLVGGWVRQPGGGLSLRNTMLQASPTGWVQSTAGAPPPRAFSAAAYDPVRHRLVLFGGSDGAAVLDDLWELQVQ